MLKLQYDRQLRIARSSGPATGWISRVMRSRPGRRREDGPIPGCRATSAWSSPQREPVSGLRLEIAVPPKMESDQVLEIRAGDWSGTEELQSRRGADASRSRSHSEAGETVAGGDPRRAQHGPRRAAIRVSWRIGS